MKETLDQESRQALVNYRIERAHEAVHEADILAREQCYNAAVNRLHYACFYATAALLLNNNITATTHAGVKTMLGLHFVSKGVLDKEHARTFQTLFDSRHSSDYEDFVYCDLEMIERLTPKVVDFIKAIEQLLAPQQ